MKNLFTNKANTVKVLGIATTVVGFGLSLVEGWVSEQKMNDIIEKKVAEAVKNITDKA